jgi:hypothetical protein
LFEHIHPEAAHFLIGPSLRAMSDVPGFTLEEKNARAATAWAVMTNVDPCDGYSLMLYGHAFVLNDLCSDAGHDALTEARSGIMPGTESPMKWRAMSAYATMHRSLCQNVSTFLRVRKELTPPPPGPPGGGKRTAKQPATEPPTGPMQPAGHAPPGAEGGGPAGRDATAAPTHPAAASFVATPRAADGERSDSEIVTKRKQNTAPEPAIARHAPDAAGEARVCVGMPTEATARACQAPVAVPPTVPPLAPLAADTTPAAADFARSRAAMVEASSDRPVSRPLVIEAGSDRPVSRPPVIASEAKQPPNAGDTLSATSSLHPVRINTGRNEPRAIATQPVAVPTRPPLAVARSHVAGTTPRRVRDGPRTNFSRRRSALSVHLIGK